MKRSTVLMSLETSCPKEHEYHIRRQQRLNWLYIYGQHPGIIWKTDRCPNTYVPVIQS